MQKVKDNLTTYGIRARISKEDEERISEGVAIKPSWESNHKDSASANIKLLVAFNPKIDYQTGEMEIGKYLGLPTFEDFHATWDKLQKGLADIVSTPAERDVMKKMRKKIALLARHDPSLQRFVEFFDDKTISNFKKVQFHNAFSKNKINYTSTFFTYDKDSNSYSYNIGNSNRTSDELTLLLTWENDFLSRFTVANDEGELTLKKKNLEDILIRYQEVKKEVTQTAEIMRKNPELYNIQDVYKQMNKISWVLKDTGLNISAQALSLYIDEYLMANSGVSAGSAILKLFTILSRVYDSKTGNSIARLITGAQVFSQYPEGSYQLTYNTPITSETRLRALLPSVTFFEKSNYENMILGQKGSKYWLYSHHDFITKSIAEWKEDPENVEKLRVMANLPGYQHSLLVQALASDPEAMALFRAHHYNNFKETGTSNDYKYTKMKRPDDRADRQNRIMRGLSPYMNTADKSNRG